MLQKILKSLAEIVEMNPIVESFYYVNYGLSIITSKDLSNKT